MTLSSPLTSKQQHTWAFGIAGLLMIILLCMAAPNLSHGDPDFKRALSKAALERTTHSVRYDGSYRSITYPNGDVPGNTGVCTDVVIRSYRALGIDLQQLVHEDMKAHFKSYPKTGVSSVRIPILIIDEYPTCRYFSPAEVNR